MEEAITVVNGGLERVRSGLRVKKVIADRWWSDKPTIRVVQQYSVGLLTWAKNHASVRQTLSQISQEEMKQHPIADEDVSMSPGKESTSSQSEGYRLDAKANNIYGLDGEVRMVVDWDGQADSSLKARLVVDTPVEEMDNEQVHDHLRFRQRVEIGIKGLLRRLNFNHFGGGEVKSRPQQIPEPTVEDEKRLLKNYKQVQTRRKNVQASLDEVSAEWKKLQEDSKAKPNNSFHLGRQELKPLLKKLEGKVAKYDCRMQELETELAWTRGEAPPSPPRPEAELDLTRESILTQMKLDIFTAQETLVDEFVEVGLKPVLREEAERQACQRIEQNKRSTAKGREGELLPADVEQLYQTKLDNLERETILQRLLNQPGEVVRNPKQRITLSVFQRFDDKRTQAAFEKYSLFLNQQRVRVPSGHFVAKAVLIRNLINNP